MEEGSGMSMVDMKSGMLHKLGLGALFRPWATRYFTLRRSADPSSHAAPLLTYYTQQSRKKIKDVPITAGMQIKLLKGAGGGWDPSRSSDPKGVGILITYGYQHSGRTEMLLVADTLREAKEWFKALTDAVDFNDRHLKLESSTSLGNSLTSTEYRKSIASCMGLLTDKDLNGPPNTLSPEKSSTSVYMIIPYLLVIVAPLLPLMAPLVYQAALWISLCYLCLYCIFVRFDQEGALLSIFRFPVKYQFGTVISTHRKNI